MEAAINLIDRCIKQRSIKEKTEKMNILRSRIDGVRNSKEEVEKVSKSNKREWVWKESKFLI